jgi:hypothetical protein
VTTFTYAVEATDDDQTWVPVDDMTGTNDDYDDDPEEFANAVLGNCLEEGIQTGPVTNIRIVVWYGPEPGTAPMAAWIAYA